MADVCQYLQPLRRSEPAFMSFWLLMERKLRQQGVVSVTSFLLRLTTCLNDHLTPSMIFSVSVVKRVVHHTHYQLYFSL